MILAPDSITPYVGLRGWGIGFIDRDCEEGSILTSGLTKRLPMLVAVAQRRGWAARRSFTAECFGEAGHSHAPVSECTCGIYSTQRVIDLRRVLLRQRYLNHKQMVPFCVGTVKQWGRLVVHEHGARSQFAYPERLFVPSHWRNVDLAPVASELEEAYQVPTEVLSPEMMAAWGTSEWEPLKEMNARKPAVLANDNDRLPQDG